MTTDRTANTPTPWLKARAASEPSATGAPAAACARVPSQTGPKTPGPGRTSPR
jgi:hypothetical protein